MPRGPGFYLNVVRPQGRIYARLARSHRVGSKVQTQIIVNFGRVTEGQVANLQQWIASNPLLPSSSTSLLTDISQVRVTRTWTYGREALGHFLWWKLGLHRIALEAFNGVPGKAHVERAVETMVLNRLADPTSKYGLIGWLDESATPFLLGYGDAPRYNNTYYRAMDRLFLRQDALEQRIYRGVVKPLSAAPDVFYHDLTSTYCERDPDGLVQFGYSRDGVDGRPQVNWGMVVTPEGFPVTSQVYPGNTKDETTVQGMRDRLQKVFGLEGGVYVGDRGMRTKDIVKDLAGHGFHYVLAEKNSTKLAQEALTLARNAQAVKVNESNVAREVATSDGGRHVVFLNERRRKEELAVLQHRQEVGKQILARWRKHAGRMHHHEILKGAQSELRKAGLQDLFDLGFDEESFQGLTSEWKEKVERTRQWAGWWVLSTDTELPIEKVAELYQGLTVIERGWREIKSVLEVRPLHHRLERRITAHLVLCELAYLMERIIEHRVREAGLVDGETPMTGWGAVRRFRTMVVNQMAVGRTGVTFQRVTEPTEEQRAVIHAVELEEDSFRKGWTGLGLTST